MELLLLPTWVALFLFLWFDTPAFTHYTGIEIPKETNQTGLFRWFIDLINCPICLGFWIAGAVCLVFQAPLIYFPAIYLLGLVLHQVIRKYLFSFRL